MSDKKNQHPKKQNEDKAKKEEKELNKELDQTFPASDPPSHTRPGHDKEEEKEKKH